MRAATGFKRSRICAVAFMMAAPLMSAPLEAEVADALGTFCESVAVMRTLSTPMPKPSAQTCAILVLRPCPISVPPWLQLTEPSM